MEHPPIPLLKSKPWIARLGALLSCLLVGACSLPGGQDVGQRTAKGGKSGRPITVDELDEITKSFADRYVLLLANACDDIKKEASSDQQRRDAHRLKRSGATAAFDAATGPDPVKQLVDLAVGVALQKIVWVDEGQGERLFGREASRRLSDALETANRELLGLCTRAMKPEQIAALQETIRQWRRANPGLQWISDVRFDIVAGHDAGKFIDGIAGALSPASGSVTDSIGQARLLGQRAFYYFKRLPRLLDWQMEEALENSLSAPEAGGVVRGVSRTLESAAGVLSRLEEILASAREVDGDGNDPKVREIHELLAEGKDLAQAAREAAAAFAELGSGPRSRTPSPPAEGNQSPAARTFDIKEYTAAGAQFSQTIREASNLLHEVRELTGSEAGIRNVETAVDAAASSVGRERLRATDHVAWRVAQLIVLTAVLASLYTAVLLWLKGRRPFAKSGRPTEENTP
jgi:hypothetical protein